MPVNLGNIEFYVGPHQAGAQDDLEAVIVNFLDQAQSTLDIAVQELDDDNIAQAVLRAAERGVRIRMVLEADYLVAKRRSTTPYTPMGPHEPNRKIHDALLRSKIWVRTDYNPKIFHQKFAVRDGQSVLTGSTNWTTTGTSKNLNHIIVIHDRKVAREFAREHKDIRAGNFGRNSSAPSRPSEIIVSGVRVKTLFAPEHSPEMEIIKQFVKARQRVDFAMFTFAKSSGIDDAMILRAEQGFPVRGLLDARQGAQRWAATPALQAAGVELRQVKKSSKVGKLHHKLMVVDDRLIIGGSFNYTGPANTTNDENIIVLGDLDLPAATQDNARRLAAYARAEINRIWEHQATDLP